MSKSEQLVFYSTQPHDCSYLKDKEAKTLFLNPEQDVTADIFSILSDDGFRRSGNYLYKPHCDDCSACISVRLPVHRFVPNKTQKKVWRINQDLCGAIKPAHYSDEYYMLYENYIHARHQDGDMYPATQEQYQNFLLSTWADTFFIEIRDDNKLLAVMVCDTLAEGFSAVYTFFDPDFDKRSLGVFVILWLIEYVKTQNKHYVYLGYWIKDCQKMSYKLQYKPIEMFINQQWLDVR